MERKERIKNNIYKIIIEEEKMKIKRNNILIVAMAVFFVFSFSIEAYIQHRGGVEEKIKDISYFYENNVEDEIWHEYYAEESGDEEDLYAGLIEI